VRGSGVGTSAIVANDANSFIWWDWVFRRPGEIWQRTVEHVQLTVAAVGIGLLISIVLSLVAVRWRWTYGPVTWVGNVLYTIPSLALFSLLIPYTGLGFTSALIALVSYTILILVRNIVAALDGVPAAVREAADGMGYTRARRLWSVELPLALPTIIAGIRIASVTVIGLVTITVLIGNGGYGVFILDGLNRSFSTPIVLGTFLSVAFAVLVDLALVLVERLLTPWRRKGGAG
jgi:osmoprotectant transport system permease protein